MSKINANTFDTLDDLLFDVYEDLISVPGSISTSRGAKNGMTSEIIGASLVLTNPRARLSRSEIKSKAFSPVGELLWYLAGSNALDFIEKYISEYKAETKGSTIHGAYGPRLFNMRGEHNQIENVIRLLRKRNTTRRAVIQLFDAEDLVGEHMEVPCTCSLQFIVREGKLNLCVSMRSNDAYMGLPHDIFTFTMLQEIVANTIGVELGNYYHFAGSLHLYDKHRENVEQYLNEGYQPTKVFMPAMPGKRPWTTIKRVVAIEEKIRKGEEVSLKGLDKYWVDIVNMIRIHFLFKAQNLNKIESLMKKMNEVYTMYIEKRLVTSQKNNTP